MMNVPVRIEEFWGAVSEDTGGIPCDPVNFFSTQAEALEYSKSHTWSGAGRTTKVMAVVCEDGKIYLLGKKIKVLENRATFEKQRALDKLTDKEKKLLGLK